MNVLDLIVLIFGIGIVISILIYFTIIEMKASVFSRLGFVGNKEELYASTFQKFDFDYTLISGIDNNENQEELISEAIKEIDVEDNPTIKEVDYYE